MKAIVHTIGYSYVRDLFSYPGKIFTITERECKLLMSGYYTISDQ